MEKTRKGTLYGKGGIGRAPATVGGSVTRSDLRGRTVIGHAPGSGQPDAHENTDLRPPVRSHAG